MKYIFAVALIALTIIFLYRTLRVISCRLTDTIPPTDLSGSIIGVASAQKPGRPKLPDFKTIRRIFKKAFVSFSTKTGLLECERIFYNNYYMLSDTVYRLYKRRPTFAKLPKGIVGSRIGETLLLSLRANEGYISTDTIRYALEKSSEIRPLRFQELFALQAVCEAALVEYAAAVMTDFNEWNQLYRKGIADGKKDKLDLTLLKESAYLYGILAKLKSSSMPFLKTICSENGISLADTERVFTMRAAKFCGRLTNVIDGLKRSGIIFTEKYLLSLSPVHKIMSQQAYGYSNTSVSTQIHYLSVVAEMARRNKQEETVIALETSLSSAKDEKDIAFYLLRRPKGKGWMRLYIAGCILTGLGLPIFLPFLFGIYGIVAYFFAVPIVLALLVRLVGDTNRYLGKRRFIPLSDSAGLEKAASRTMITVSQLIADAEEMKSAIEHLETLKYANPIPGFRFCLLADLLPGNDDQLSQRDEEILQTAQRAYNALAQRESYCILVRKRTLAGKTFGGWEKKRGALIELNTLIRTGQEMSGFYLRLGEVSRTDYVIALDADTLICNASDLVCAMQHPYNTSTNVIGLLMRTSTASAGKTRFSRLFSGSIGLDSYNQYVCDIHYDFFGSGNYTGKGIYRVQQFDQLTGKAFPENRILSHDFIEGAFAGCAVGNFYGLDTFPENYSSFLTRQLRWQRGDIQLAPYLFRKVRNADSKKVHNPILPIAKWHIFLNILFPFLPIAKIGIIALSLLTSPFLLFFAFAPELLTLLKSARAVILGGHNFGEDLARVLLEVAFLPIMAWYAFYTFTLTCSRMIRKKKLLEWKVFAHAKGKISFLPSLISGCALAVVGIWLWVNPAFYVLAALFLLAWPLDVFLRREYKVKQYQNENFEVLLRDTADKIMHYFDAQTEFGVPCDNYAENVDLWALRVSPTDIGMALVAHVCFAVLGIKTYAAAQDDAEKLLMQIEKAPKWRGHLYNWMGTDLTVLEPRYISTVDSGNLLAALVLVQQYFPALNQYTDTLIAEMDMDALVDRERGLFFIGYNESNDAYDGSHYNLFGSESIIAYIISIGLGKIPGLLWNNLDISKVRYAKYDIFYSWTGGLFEYLMSAIFFEYSPLSGLYESTRSSALAHIKHAQKNKEYIWGRSECQYSDTDSAGNYGYRAFGVPEIALSDSGKDKVFAPYGSLLAVPFTPRATYENVRKIIGKGGYGQFGFYDAIRNDLPIKSYMAHHQGMAIAGICNYLSNGELWKIMKKSPAVRAAAMYFDRRYPGKGKIRRFVPDLPHSENEQLPIDEYKYPIVALMGDSLRTLIDIYGKGYSIFGNVFLHRYIDRSDGIFLRINYRDKKLNPTERAVKLSGEECVFVTENKDLFVCTTISIVEDVEIRTIRIRNKTSADLTIATTAMAIPSLLPRADYASHPVFNDMFTETFLKDNCVFARRTDNKSDLIAAMCGLGANGECFGNRTATFGGTKDFGRTLEPALGYTSTETIPGHGEVAVHIFITAGYDVTQVGKKLAQMSEKKDSVWEEARALSAQIAPSTEACRLASVLLYGRSAYTEKIEQLDMRRPTYVYEYSNTDAWKQILRILSAVCDYKISFNLAVIYREPMSYFNEIANTITTGLEEWNIARRLDGRCLLVNEETESQLASLVRAAGIPDNELLNATFMPVAHRPKKPAPIQKPNITHSVFCGGFESDGTYFIDVSDRDTPAPWSNVIADKNFGTMVTESGGAFTWYLNSREGKLTEFQNDPHVRMPSEYIVYSENSLLWSATKKPIHHQNCSYYVRHSFGYTEYLCNFNGLLIREKQFIAKQKNAKLFTVSIKNALKYKRRIHAMAVAVPVLGDFKFNSSFSYGSGYKGIWAKNSNQLKMYLSSDHKMNSCSFHKEAFMQCGKIVTNTKLADGGSDPALAYSVTIVVPADGEVVFHFAISPNGYMFDDPIKDFEESVQYFSSLSDTRVSTGMKNLDYLLLWLPYQTTCSRFFGKCGYYQVSGGYGFRDQLQDCLTMLRVDPAAVRQHILTCAAHQFSAGDVMHWWHPPAIGVRTHICDDRLFLPLIVTEYIRYTGDFAILAERIPFLSDVTLPEHAESVYTSAETSNESASLLEHCKRAIDVSLDFGVHGLVKMKGGDWNDAMNKVGSKGKGESVWATMFLYYVMDQFADILSDTDCKIRYLEIKMQLMKALENAWDNDRYVRLFTDDGKVLGSMDNDECKIDLLTQAWAALSGACPKDKASCAVKTASTLIDESAGVIKLFTPPLINTKDIGYITSYPAGVRENGGQYTHATVWYIAAMYALDHPDAAYRLLELINPIQHSLADGENYRVEPYVLPADVYSGKFGGRGGWTWYTGGASWLYATILENLIGLKRYGKRLVMHPNPPRSIRQIQVSFRYEQDTVTILIDNTEHAGTWGVVVDGIRYNTNEISLTKSLSGKTVCVKRQK